MSAPHPEPGTTGRADAARAAAGRRRRRVRRTVAAIATVVVVGTAAGYVVIRRSGPAVRRPGEALDDITDNLARGLPPGAPAPRFADRTAAAGLADFVVFAGDRSSQLPEDMGGGAAWGDFDRDGDEDLFLVGAGAALSAPVEARAACALYENRGDGTFVRSDAFPETRIMGMGAAWADYDADGWLDLVVSGFGTLRLFRNAEGRLVPDDALPDLDGYWSGVAWGDFDNDRDLDLYVCGYVAYVGDAGGVRQVTRQYGGAVPYTLNPASFDPAPNLLFRNDGAGGFAEIAGEVGVRNPEGRSLGAIWHDFDGDGRLDLYVANDISDNAFFLNRGGTFEEIGLKAFVADYRGAMGLAVGDWNRDGDDDLFITHWVAQENALYDSQLADMRRDRIDVGDGPPIMFSDRAVGLGLGHVALRLVGWGTEFADLDGDGWLDLVVANGSTQEIGAAPRRLKPEPMLLLWNQHGAYFHDLAPLHPVLAAPHVARGLALADHDGDGDLDLVTTRLDEGVQLLDNEMQSGAWLELRLRSRLGPAGAPVGEGEGAQVVVRHGDVAQRRSVATASYLSQSSRMLHFGLADAVRADVVEVHWHAGAVQRFEGLRTGARWELVEDDPLPRALATAAEEPEAIRRARLTAFWAEHRAAMDALKRDGDVRAAEVRFRAALGLDPRHEDARYYLANCLAARGEIDESLRHLEELVRVNPTSHRGWSRWGALRAIHARSADDLDAASAALERAIGINREETGARRILGEVAILRGDAAAAARDLGWVCQTNPASVGAQFLLGYLDWRAGDRAASVRRLEAARTARGGDWKPAGAVAEGDVARRLHVDGSPLAAQWEAWDGGTDPDVAYAALHASLASTTARSR